MMTTVMGIVKAYTTRVGAGPFPTELFDSDGDHLAKNGHEFGATTGRPRRCGWFDAVLAKRACWINSVDSLCVTKLDVLDTLAEIKICTSYKLDGETITQPPWDSRSLDRCMPNYETLPGWSGSTVGARTLSELPREAKNFISRLEELLEVPIDIVSTGPDREETMVLKNLF